MSGGWVVMLFLLVVVAIAVAAVALDGWDEAVTERRKAEVEREAMATKLAALQASSRLHTSAWAARQDLLREAWAARALPERDG